MSTRSRDAGSRLTNAEAAGERYFRLYYKHVTQADVDTLFNLLEGMHSLNDRLEKQTRRDFHDLEDFLALAPLRNLFHHQTELLHEVKVIPAARLPPISTDQLYLCLVPRELVELAGREIRGKHRPRGEEAMRRKLKWYGSVVNINPSLLNFSVCAYERLKETGLELKGAEYRTFEASYRMEAEAGHPHLVTGDIHCHAASVDEVLATVFRE